MLRVVLRVAGVGLSLALATLGLVGCDVGAVVLEGTLTHAETGAPLAAVPVRLYSSTEQTVVARGRTGDDGAYRIRSGALADGTYRVVFSADHWWENGDSWSTATDVSVSAGAPAVLDAALVPATTLVFGETFIPAGPIPMRVDAFHADTGDLVATTYSEEVPPSTRFPWGSTGAYELLLPAGDLYTLRASDRTTDWYYAAGGPASGFGFEAPPGEHQIDFLTSSQESALYGRVVDGGGTPIAGARVLALPDLVPPKPQEATTGTDGSFNVAQLESGYYRLLVVGPDGSATLAGMVGGDPATATRFWVEFMSATNVGDITLGEP